MKIGELATKEVISAGARLTVEQGARLMRDKHVGDLVVSEDIDGKRKPVGIVTDRDIVIGVTALGLDASVLTLGDIMNLQLFTANEEADADTVMQRMRQMGIRRAPVVDKNGYLSGMFTLDDYLDYLGRSLLLVRGLIKSEQSHEEQARLTLS